MPVTLTLDRSRLARLMDRELATFAADNPRSLALHERARGSLLDGVPMNWMVKWAGGFPLFVDTASGAHFVDVDGHDYIDFCLGDTGAMAGHSPAPTVAAVERQLRRGITLMLPIEDAIAAGDELRRRFGLRYWQFTITATDANRFSLRLARHISGRSKVVVHDHNYHGSVDETFASLDADGPGRPEQGQHGAGGRPGADDPRRPLQRRRGARARPRRPRRRGGPDRAGADERRHRASRSRLSRCRPPPDP